MMRRIYLFAILLALVIVSGCARFEQRILTEVLPEEELYRLGVEKYNQQSWEDAIAAFDRFERLYVNSDKIQDVRLKRADAHFNHGTTTSLITAKSEYQSFLALYPRYERDDFIWLQIAKCSFEQMLPPNRDQTPTEEAIEDLEKFVEKYPDSPLMPEAREYLNKAYLSYAKYHVVVADHYYGRGMYTSAAGRYELAIKMKVELENTEDILYKLTFTSARSATDFALLHDFAKIQNRSSMVEYYSKKFSEVLYQTNKYLEDYKTRYPNMTSRISELQNEVNRIMKPGDADIRKAPR